jgi:hypothetical protein
LAGLLVAIAAVVLIYDTAQNALVIAVCAVAAAILSRSTDH